MQLLRDLHVLIGTEAGQVILVFTNYGDNEIFKVTLLVSQGRLKVRDMKLINITGFGYA